MATWKGATARWERFGPRARDVVFVVVSLLATVAETLARRDEGAVAVVVLIAGTAGSVTLWWRRTHPVLVTLAGIATLAATRLSVVLVVGLFTLAIRRRDRVLVAMTVAAAAALAIDSAVGSSRSWPSDVLSGVITAGLLRRRRLLRRSAARPGRGVARTVPCGPSRNRSSAPIRRALGERARIAREMHDVVAHKVSLIALHAGALEVQSAPTAEQVGITAGLIRTTAHEAMEDLRKVLGVLRAADGDGSDLAPPPRLDDLVRVVEASRAAGVQAELVVAVGDLPDERRPSRPPHRPGSADQRAQARPRGRHLGDDQRRRSRRRDRRGREPPSGRGRGAAPRLGLRSGRPGGTSRPAGRSVRRRARHPTAGGACGPWLPWTPAPAPASVVRPP